MPGKEPTGSSLVEMGWKSKFPTVKSWGCLLPLEKKGKFIITNENTLTGMLSILLDHVLVKVQ